MKKVYICSPLRGDIEQNIARALDHCREAAELGVIPLAPHAYFTQFLDDTDPEERALGIKLGQELLKSCDEVWVYGRASAGMAAEIVLAGQLGIPVLDAEEVYKQAQGKDEKPTLGKVTIHVPGQRSYLRGAPDREPFDVVLSGSVIVKLAELLGANPGDDLNVGRC